MRAHIWKSVVAVVLLALAGFCLWVYASLEFVEREIEVGFQGKAAQIPVLAAGRLAERYGAHVEFVPVLHQPPPPGAVLFFGSSRFWLSPRKNEMLLRWVREEGGHLLVVPESGSAFVVNRPRDGEETKPANDDPLLSFLGFSVAGDDSHEDDEDDEDEESGEDADAEKNPDDENTGDGPNKEDEENTRMPDGKAAEAASQPPRCAAPRDTLVALPDGSTLYLRIDTSRRLVDENRSAQWRLRIADEADEADGENGNAAENENGDYGLSYAVGKGRITVLGNLGFMRNSRIGDADHAALFTYLAAPAAGKKIWFVYGSDVPSLWEWLTQRAWTALIAAAALLAAWLWMTSRRFGPLLPAPQTSRRSIAEHVAASGRYLWRQDRGRWLYLTLRDNFRRHIALRHPQWARLRDDELARQIVEFIRLQEASPAGHGMGGATPRTVAALLDPTLARDRRKFTEDAQLLETLKKHL